MFPPLVLLVFNILDQMQENTTVASYLTAMYLVDMLDPQSACFPGSRISDSNTQTRCTNIVGLLFRCQDKLGLLQKCGVSACYTGIRSLGPMLQWLDFCPPSSRHFTGYKQVKISHECTLHVRIEDIAVYFGLKCSCFSRNLQLFRLAKTLLTKLKTCHLSIHFNGKSLQDRKACKI